MSLFAIWMGGFPALGVAAGLFGGGSRPMRLLLVWIGAALSLGVLLYALVAGGPNGRAYIAGVNTLGLAVIVVVVALCLAPMLAAKVRSRIPSVMATILLAVLVLSFPLGLFAWMPAASCVLAAAIAGPPDPRG